MVNYTSEMKKLGFYIFHYVLLELASKEEIGRRLIILRVWNIISMKFLLFFIHSSYWMEDTKFMQNVKSVVSLESITRVCFCGKSLY